MKEKPSYYRSFARIDLDAIENNFNELKALLAPKVKTMCVIKADAYGHGSHRIALFLQNKCDYFAVASINEGEELRRCSFFPMSALLNMRISSETI